MSGDDPKKNVDEPAETGTPPDETAILDKIREVPNKAEMADGYRLLWEVSVRQVEFIMVALWAFKTDEYVWKLFLAPAQDTRDTRVASSRVQGVLESLVPPPAITMQDVSVISRNDQLIQMARSACLKLIDEPKGKMIRISHVPGYADTVFLYRMM